MGQQWMVAVAAERFQAERLYQRDQLELPLPSDQGLSVGDAVALVTSGPRPVVFGLARVVAVTSGGSAATGPGGGASAPNTIVEYTRRLIDRPVPADQAGCAQVAEHAVAAPVAVDADLYQRLVSRLASLAAPAAPTDEWMVSLSLPIEASSPAEAVRVFWSYVRQLGPQELPAFVWPRGDEMAMRPYVLGAEHEMDPEED